MAEKLISYSGAALLADLSQPEAHGTLTVGPHELCFQSEAWQCSLAIGRLILDRDENGRLQFTDPEQPQWIVLCDDDAILKNYFLQRSNAFRGQTEAMRRQREGKRNVKLAGAFLLAFAAVALLLWHATGWMVTLLVNRVPVSWEKQMSNQALAELKEQAGIIETPAWPEWFQPTVDQLTRNLPDKRYKFEFLMLDDPRANAIALPGGKVLICEGLFKMAETPDELAGVLAHEMAHVRLRHGLRRLITAMGPYYVLRLFISDESGFIAVLSGGSQLLVQQSFSRDYEREADTAAWHHLQEAGFDPRGLVTFFRKLADDPLNRVLESAVPEILLSHPPTRERIEHLEKLARKREKK